MNKRLIGVFLGLFFALAIIGLVIFLVGFVESPETMRLSPQQESGSSMNSVSDAEPELAVQQSSYLESLIEWFEQR